MTLGLGGCGTGFSAQTNQVYQPGVGANARGDVDSLNTLLVANSDGTATLSASLHNNLDAEQSLSSVKVASLSGEELVVQSPKIMLPLPADGVETLGGPQSAGIFTVTKDAPAGAYVTVTYTFSDSPALTVQAPIVARSAEYASVSPGGAGEPDAEPAAE